MGKTERQATLIHTCDSYSYKEEGDEGQCPVRLVSVSSHVYDRGRGKMEEGGGRERCSIGLLYMLYF